LEAVHMISGTHVTSEVSYRLLVEGIVDVAIYMLELDGTVASWNLAAERIKGYRAAEIIGQNFSVFFSEKDRERGEPAHALAVARTTGKYAGEGWRVRKDGHRFWADVVVDALRNEHGNLIGFAKITRDVTERSIAEDQRRVIVSAAPNGMLIIDETGTITLANARAERIFGYRAGSVAGLPIERLLTGDAIDRPVYRNTLPRLDTGSTHSDFCAREELTGRRRDGSAFPAEVTFKASATARSPVVVASITDITERRTIEEQRRRAEADVVNANRLVTMAEMAHYGHWRVDLGTKEVYWSPEMYRTHGFPTTAKPNLQRSLASYGDDAAHIAEIIRRASLDGEPFTFESRIVRPDGSFRDVRCSGRGERDADDPLVGLVGIFQDITERRDVERERERLIERVTLATRAGKVGVWEWDVRTGAMAWDAHMFALYGKSTSGPASYEAWQSALHSDDRARAAGEIQDALADRKPFDSEFRVVWPSGEVHNVRAQATVVRDTAGKAERMVGINWDVSEVRSLADQLHEEQERQRTQERERLYERERKWSTTFQRAVLPLALPHVAGYVFDAVYEPGLADAQVGGDWYDAVHLIDGRILVSIGDVSGSGLEAAVVVGVARQIVRGISQFHANPMLILDAADRALCLEYPGVYVSAWVGLIDLVTRTMTYASAGHPPPLLVSARWPAARRLRAATGSPRSRRASPR
jgi:PAS domain S-box-containing protein